jgi:hypothetical protein
MARIPLRLVPQRQGKGYRITGSRFVFSFQAFRDLKKVGALPGNGKEDLACWFDG